MSWCAPELILGNKVKLKPHTTADVFSFGRVCFMVFTCQWPVNTEQVVNLKPLAAAGKVPPLAWVDDGASRCWGMEMQSIINRCVEFKPETRPSIVEVHHGLESLKIQSDKNNLADIANSPSSITAEALQPIPEMLGKRDKFDFSSPCNSVRSTPLSEKRLSEIRKKVSLQQQMQIRAGGDRQAVQKLQDFKAFLKDRGVDRDKVSEAATKNKEKSSTSL